jgi:hypothetical protein
MLKADILSLFIPGPADEVAKTLASAGSRKNDDYQRKFATNMTYEEVAAEHCVGFNKCIY